MATLCNILDDVLDVAPELDVRDIHHIRLRNVNKAERTLALKLRGDVPRNPKQGYQWPQNRTCECVRQKTSLGGGGGRGGGTGTPVLDFW